jgi:hypothetical protein
MSLSPISDAKKATIFDRKLSRRQPPTSPSLPSNTPGTPIRYSSKEGKQLVETWTTKDALERILFAAGLYTGPNQAECCAGTG